MAVVVENPYFQYLCGAVSFCPRLPVRPSLTRWRQRLGEAELEALLQESLSVAHKTGAIARSRTWSASWSTLHGIAQGGGAPDRRADAPSAGEASTLRLSARGPEERLLTAPPNVTRHLAVAMNGPIGCGGVAIFPGDVIVGDADGVVAIPRHLAEEVARDALDQERLEAFLLEEIRSGKPLFGTYPPSEATRERFRAQTASTPGSSP